MGVFFPSSGSTEPYPQDMTLTHGLQSPCDRERGDSAGSENPARKVVWTLMRTTRP